MYTDGQAGEEAFTLLPQGKHICNLQARSQVLCWGGGGGGGGVPRSFAMANEWGTLEFKCTNVKLQGFFFFYIRVHEL